MRFGDEGDRLAPNATQLHQTVADVDVDAVSIRCAHTRRVATMGVNAHPVSKLADLLPWNWQPRQV